MLAGPSFVCFSLVLSYVVFIHNLAIDLNESDMNVVRAQETNGTIVEFG